MRQGKSKVLVFSGGISGFISFLGSYQVCHNLCLGVVALLSILGIAVVGMPLLFLTKVALYFWIAAVIMLFITFLLFLRKKIISSKILILNTGFIMAGIPFSSLQHYSLIFWIIGGFLVAFSLFSYGYNYILGRNNRDKKKRL